MTENIAKRMCENYLETVSNEFAQRINGLTGIALVNTEYHEVYYHESWASLFRNYVLGEILDDFDSLGEDDVKEYLGEELYKIFIEDYVEEISFQDLTKC